MKKNILLIFVISLGFSGCMMGPDFQKPVVNTPAEFNYEMVKTDTVLNLRWWELFQDPQLVTLIDTALKNNKNILIAASRVEEARLVVGYTKADQWPSIGYTGKASRMDLNLLGNNDASNSFSTMGNINWEIDFWGKYRRSTESARADLLATRYAHRIVQVSLISEIANTYFLLLNFKAKLEISKQTLNTRQEGLRIMNSKFEHGVIPQIDLNQAEIQEAIAASAVPTFIRAIAQTEHALSILLGQNPDSMGSIGKLSDEQAPEIPAGIPSELLERRPDVMQAEYVLAAQNARIGIAQAMRFPSISLTGSLGMASGDLSSFLSSPAWSFGAGITGPILNFGKNKRRVEIEKQRTEQALLNYENVVLQSFREVEDALVEIQTLEQELQAVLRQKNASENAVMLSHERYHEGVTSYLEVLDSDRSQFNADLAAADTYQRYLNAHVKLYKALGGGWISPEEEKGSTEE
ncbi:MAG: efflux transporter outer membrane subunit [Bacteroidota bacterium]|nr:efflux transporter outer membrane subunit [Bacteroidota bacterium]